jgi:predicted outer membrane repeat protein
MNARTLPVRAALSAIIIACLCVPGVLSAGVTNVTSGGPEYAALLPAVGAALSGDELRVSTGRYTGNITISGKHVTIAGGYIAPGYTARVPDRNATIISTNIPAPIFLINQDAGMTFDRCTIADGGLYLIWGGNIFVSDNCVLTMRQCRVRSGLGWWGGGVCAWSNTTVVLDDTEIMDNNAVFAGGGVYGHTESRITVAGGSLCRGNAAPLGGGIALNRARLDLFDMVTVSSNTAADYGGGIFLDNASVGTLADALIAANNATGRFGSGGGIAVRDSTVAVTGPTTRVIANAAYEGGGVYCYDSTASFSNVRVIDNHAINAGGGMLVSYCGTVPMRNCIIADNRCMFSVGGLYSDECDAWFIESSQFVSNTARTVGAIEIDNAALVSMRNVQVTDNVASDRWGGIDLYFARDFKCENVEFSRNSARNGYGGGDIGALTALFVNTDVIGNVGNSDTETNGVYGGLRIENHGGYGPGSCTFIASNRTVRVAENQAAHYAGLHFVGTGVVSVYTVGSGSIEFTGNTAAGDGGAISALGRPALVVSGNVFFVDNHARDGAGIWVSNTPLRIVNGRLHDNVAERHGGGIFAIGRVPLTLESRFGPPAPDALPPTRLTGNRAAEVAGNGGAIAVIDGTSLSVDAAFMLSNSAEYGGAIHAERTPCTLINVLAVQNAAASAGAGLRLVDSPCMVLESTFADNDFSGVQLSGGSALGMTNSIVWGHLGVNVTPGQQVNYCDIQGGYPGHNNTNLNPLFRSPATFDYQLEEVSPCVEAGASLGNVLHDCIGNPRPDYGPKWDMGAYEFVPEPAAAGAVVFALLIVARSMKLRG